MNQQIANSLNAAEDGVTSLVEECRKDGPLYKQSPKAAAQVSRTGKWLLNAIATLRKELKPPRNDRDPAA